MKNFHLQQVQKARYDAIAVYAAEMAGTRLDLDSGLESAGIEHLMNTMTLRKPVRESVS